MKMKFSIFFLFALQLSPKIPSAIGLKCYDCDSEDNHKLKLALAEKEGRQRGNLNKSENETPSEPLSCERLEWFANHFSSAAKEVGNKLEGSVECKGDKVCTALMYDIKLDGKIYKYNHFECSSPSDLKKLGSPLKIGYCVDYNHFKTEEDFKAAGGKISNNRICACNTDYCDPLSLPYDSAAGTTTLASGVAAVSSLGVICATTNVARRLGVALLVVTLFSLM